MSELELTFIRESELAAERGRQRELEQARALAYAERRRVFNLRLALLVAIVAAAIIGWLYVQSRNASLAATNARWAEATAAASEGKARQTAEASTGLAQQKLAQLEGERLLKDARGLKENCDVQGAIAQFAAAARADSGLKLDLKAEEDDVRRQCATRWVQEGEKLAAASKHKEAAEQFRKALELEPPPDTFVYVRIPKGEFIMGSKDGDPDALANEKPQHTVPVEEFWIMRTEVTNAQYLRCVKARVCTPPDNQRYDKPKFANEPVTDVNWDQANAYARWVGGRLPTEAEWEKACRGTDAAIYPWGFKPPSPDLLNFLDSGLNTVTDVGTYPDGRSPYGLLDMAGNVWEWTSSLLYKGYPYKVDDGREDPRSRDPRALRGGSFWNDDQHVRCACRLRGYPDHRNVDVGFRVVSPGF